MEGPGESKEVRHVALSIQTNSFTNYNNISQKCFRAYSLSLESRFSSLHLCYLFFFFVFGEFSQNSCHFSDSVLCSINSQFSLNWRKEFVVLVGFYLLAASSMGIVIKFKYNLKQLLFVDSNYNLSYIWSVMYLFKFFLNHVL